MKQYLISDPRYYRPYRFANAFARAYRRFHPDFVCLRDKQTREYPRLARLFLRQSRRFKARAILHNDWHLAKKLKAHGVHLSADRAREIKAAARSSLFTIASCHSEAEAKRALKSGSSRVVISPIFSVANKGRAKGIGFLNALDPTIRAKTIALGGIISDDEVSAARETGVFAFASIRYFTKDFRGF
ncbi:MAG: thiamine phosphate synthase [Helicobacteraceae bacterium]|jgi:thiamine-phosphate pyrophosphorylase|nr:thiamine phosphate synthase [Helicobacteraceae bacterium]